MIPVMILEGSPIYTWSIYAMQTEEEVARRMPVNGGIYWKDHIRVQGVGPFLTFNEAWRHFKLVTAGDRMAQGDIAVVPKTPVKDNVTTFNFVTRKRQDY